MDLSSQMRGQWTVKRPPAELVSLPKAFPRRRKRGAFPHFAYTNRSRCRKGVDFQRSLSLHARRKLVGDTNRRFLFGRRASASTVKRPWVRRWEPSEKSALTFHRVLLRGRRRSFNFAAEESDKRVPSAYGNSLDQALSRTSLINSSSVTEISIDRVEFIAPNGVTTFEVNPIEDAPSFAPAPTSDSRTTPTKRTMARAKWPMRPFPPLILDSKLHPHPPSESIQTSAEADGKSLWPQRAVFVVEGAHPATGRHHAVLAFMRHHDFRC